jgi:hypothetical protein
MTIALPLFVMGLVLDDRTITGAAAWLKPVKFATSIAIYTLTLAWIFTWLPGWARMRTLVGWTTAVTLTLEMVLIALQAARGQASHFNNATPFDALVFTTMGIAIVVNTLAGIAVAAALWRERLPDRALGAALRLGMSLTVIGAVGGGLMLGPTARQQQEAPSGHRMPVVGGHSVGGLDGGRGLPLTQWSTEHGDLRVAHFVGLHAVQVLTLVAVLLGRRGIEERVRHRLVLIGAASYAGLFVLLLIQALRSQPVVAPDATSLTLFMTWAVATLALTVGAVRRRTAQVTSV